MLNSRASGLPKSRPSSSPDRSGGSPALPAPYPNAPLSVTAGRSGFLRKPRRNPCLYADRPVPTRLTCGRGETGRRKGLKIPRPQGCTGSIPVVRTNFPGNDLISCTGEGTSPFGVTVKRGRVRRCQLAGNAAGAASSFNSAPALRCLINGGQTWLRPFPFAAYRAASAAESNSVKL